MSQLIESAVQSVTAKLNDFIELHRGQRGITLTAHVRAKRKERSACATTRELIYLDTNAWKCMADYRQGKSTLTAAMIAFGQSLERAVRTDAFVFPIGLPTFFELDSMTHPTTRNTMTALVDELSRGLCIAPFQDRVGYELRQLRRNDFDTPDELADFLCSPIELLGIPALSLPGFAKEHVDEETFNKAFFDSISELPFSFQLEMAGLAPSAKWNNSRGIADLNAGRTEHQDQVVNLNTGIFLELKGCIAAWFDHEGIELGPKDIGHYALNAQYHWHQSPATRALPTLRILSSLYGLMRFDSQRKYHGGDPNDFMVAASALPVARALFTDRKLSNLLSDPRIGLSRFSDCTVVSGFDEMAKYLISRL